MAMYSNWEVPTQYSHLTDVISQKTMGKPYENDGFMGFHGIYPLVMTNIAMEITMLLMGQSTISMVIIHNSVSLPEGICHRCPSNRCFVNDISILDTVPPCSIRLPLMYGFFDGE